MPQRRTGLNFTRVQREECEIGWAEEADGGEGSQAFGDMHGGGRFVEGTGGVVAADDSADGGNLNLAAMEVAGEDQVKALSAGPGDGVRSMREEESEFASRPWERGVLADPGVLCASEHQGKTLMLDGQVALGEIGPAKVREDGTRGIGRVEGVVVAEDEELAERRAKLA